MAKPRRKSTVSEESAKARMTDLAEKAGYSFVGFVGNYSTLSSTKVSLYCEKHKVQWEIDARSMRNPTISCPDCLTESRKSRLRLPDSVLTARYMASGKYLAGTKFERGEKPQTWVVYCPVCSSDEYVKAGVCDGKFLAYSGGLDIGSKSCRCNPGFHYTPAQREYQIKKTFSDENLRYTFMGWVGDARAGKRARVRIECVDHGEFTPLLDSYLNAYKSRCPGCAKYGFKPYEPASFYVIRTTTFTGYGITCDVKYRMSLHRKNLHRDAGDSLKEVVHFPMIGYQAKTLEDQVRLKFPLFSTQVKGFVRESTDLELFEDVVSYAEKFHDALSDVTRKSSTTPYQTLRGKTCPRLTLQRVSAL